MSGSVRISDLTWRAVEEAYQHKPVILVPMASTEEHGPHSPMGDYVNTDLITEQVAQATGSLMTPVIPFGYSEYFRHYPGTITIQPETLSYLVRDIIESLREHGITHIVLVNGHAGNNPILMPLVRRIRREQGLLIPIVASSGFGLTPELKQELYGDTPIGHGGEPMGSTASYLRPELVQMERAEEYGPQEFLGLSANLNGVVFQGRNVGLAVNMEDITPPSGSLSDPHEAAAERGERIVKSAVEGLSEFVNWFKTIDPEVSG